MKKIFSTNNKPLHTAGAAGRGEGKFFLRIIKKYYFIFIVLFVFILSGIVSGLGIYYTGVHIFPIHEIVLTGNKHLTDSELKAMTGTKPGDSLFELSTRKVSDRLLKSPWIKAVSIRKGYPDKVWVKVYEAAPFAILQKDGGAFLIDETGSLLDKIDSTVPFLPVIAVSNVRNAENLTEALKLARVLKGKGLATERNRVEVIAKKDPEDMAVVIDDLVIKVGSGDYKQKIERLFDAEKEIEKRAIAVDYVDLRFANKVVVKPLNEVIR